MRHANVQPDLYHHPLLLNFHVHQLKRTYPSLKSTFWTDIGAVRLIAARCNNYPLWMVPLH